MIINGKTLFDRAPIKNMLDCKVNEHGVSHGLGEAGYDIRLKQSVSFYPPLYHIDGSMVRGPNFILDGGVTTNGNHCLASAIEEFNIPNDMAAIVHDKSTWARQGLSVFNTVLEPGWFGFLTLELVFHGSEPLYIPAGAGIAQVLFHATSDERAYTGKYQAQEDRPVHAIMAQSDN